MSTFDDEKRMQPYMDGFYKNRGYYSLDRTCSCKRYDLKIGYMGVSVTVEEKFLFTDRVYDQMIVEIIQDLSSRSDGYPGWFYHVDCDYLIWAYCNKDRRKPPRDIYWISYPEFRNEVISQYRDIDNGRMFKVPENYGDTLNIPIKWDLLLEKKIAKRFKLNGDEVNGHRKMVTDKQISLWE